MIITYIHSTSPADALRVQLRCRNFADAINRIGWHSANLLDLDSFLQNTPKAQGLCAASDLLVIHRYFYGSVLQAVEYWKARGKKVIVDFDQAINYLPPELHSHSFWEEDTPLQRSSETGVSQQHECVSNPLEQFKWGLGLIDAAVVSSMRLVVDWSPFANVYEIPDYLNIDQYPAFKQVHEKILIGLTNGIRTTSINNSGLLKALKNVCCDRSDVQVIWIGEEGEAGCLADIPSSQLLIQPSTLLDEWANILLRLDLGLIPIYGDYDLRSSRITLLEFMISKTPWIASTHSSLREFSHYGKLIENSSSVWETAILHAVDHLELFQRKAAAEPFLFALSQDVNQNIDKVLKLFTYILNQAE